MPVSHPVLPTAGKGRVATHRNFARGFFYIILVEVIDLLFKL